MFAALKLNQICFNESDIFTLKKEKKAAHSAAPSGKKQKQNKTEETRLFNNSVGIILFPKEKQTFPPI